MVTQMSCPSYSDNFFNFGKQKQRKSVVQKILKRGWQRGDPVGKSVCLVSLVTWIQRPWMHLRSQRGWHGTSHITGLVQSGTWGERVTCHTVCRSVSLRYTVLQWETWGSLAQTMWKARIPQIPTVTHAYMCIYA